MTVQVPKGWLTGWGVATLRRVGRGLHRAFGRRWQDRAVRRRGNANRAYLVRGHARPLAARRRHQLHGLGGRRQRGTARVGAGGAGARRSEQPGACVLVWPSDRARIAAVYLWLINGGVNCLSLCVLDTVLPSLAVHSVACAPARSGTSPAAFSSRTLLHKHVLQTARLPTAVSSLVRTHRPAARLLSSPRC